MIIAMYFLLYVNVYLKVIFKRRDTREKNFESCVYVSSCRIFPPYILQRNNKFQFASLVVRKVQD